jgi:hypothetical protein
MVYSPGGVAGGITSLKRGSGADIVRTRMGNSSGGMSRVEVIVVITGTPSLRVAVRVSPATARNVRGAIDCATSVLSRQKPRSRTLYAP